MIVGATGSGKSTLIDGMANYVMGVTWEDTFRFSLINELKHSGNQVSLTKHVLFQMENSLMFDTNGIII